MKTEQTEKPYSIWTDAADRHAWKKENNPTRPSEQHDTTELWPDEIKHALATVVSLVANHASARESAEWSVFWGYIAEAVNELPKLKNENLARQKECQDWQNKALEAWAQRDELLATLKALNAGVAQLEGQQIEYPIARTLGYCVTAAETAIEA